MASRTSSRSLSSASLGASRDRLPTPAPPDPFAAEKEQKTSQITAACDARDLATVVELAASAHGLVSDHLRRTAWPLLLGCDEPLPSDSWKELPAHRDEGQVALDVNRAFVYYPIESDRQLDARKEELSSVIVEVLRRHPTLNYFQGYHDIVQVFLLALGAHNAPPAVARLSLLRIRDFMLPSLDPAISHLYLLPPIIQSADPSLHSHLPMVQPFFALGATITLFAHVVQEYGDIARLFDFFLASDAVIPVYFFAAVIISRRDELLDIEKDDVDIFHAVLGKLPQPFDLELLVQQTRQMYARHPPSSLKGWAWWSVSSLSVLKATRTPFDVAKTTLPEGEALFQKQAIEMQRKQAMQSAVKRAKHVRAQLWHYRRSGLYGLAIMVGVYALWIGRNGGMIPRFMNIRTLGDSFRRVLAIFV
ncbi:hypothetical protein EJ04DRAFT_469619 [Polyplosphaeria fusca]|uniref:Rab-GAP TBC domain-containing protein n=1 Tax=Polyplosphaeria fusca TaxID=682080 RepID=A0A9P4QRY9_9PLEO|nr:hypothetical protein EJ04DRAFT_469619 [Polyplosphaeria fusca]